MFRCVQLVYVPAQVAAPGGGLELLPSAPTAAPLAPLAADAEADSGDDEDAFFDAAGAFLDD